MWWERQASTAQRGEQEAESRVSGVCSMDWGGASAPAAKTRADPASQAEF